MPGGTHLGSYYLWGAPIDIPLTEARAVAGSALVVFIMIVRCTSEATIRES